MDYDTFFGMQNLLAVSAVLILAVSVALHVSRPKEL